MVRFSDPDDPSSGLAFERTELAWNRSALAVTVCCGVLVRRVWPLDSPGHLLAVAAIAVGIGTWIAVLALAARHGSPGTARGRALRRIVLATVAFAGAGLAIGLFPSD